MEIPFETNYLVPNATFFVELVMLLAVMASLVIWPLVETVVRRQWGWTLGVLLLGPIGGLLWFLWVVVKCAATHPRPRPPLSSDPGSSGNARIRPRSARTADERASLMARFGS